MEHIVVLTGAGISAESGLKTFRDANGLWEGHEVMSVASPEGFEANPDLVLDFYNQRRRQLLEVQPNAAHFELAKLENDFKVTIITQNVDDLHERAGSSSVIHLHGELLKARSVSNENDVFHWTSDLNYGDCNAVGEQLRPHIVWFGEAVPLIEEAMMVCQTATTLIIVGTSMQVYPAAGLLYYIREETPVYFVDPDPNITTSNHLTVIAKPATLGVKEVIEMIKTKAE